MLFNFSLTPLNQVEPWGHQNRLSLHWFGLTDGHYWIEAGTEVLFKYSNHAHQHLGAPQYCNYQVARLHEDLFDLLPYVLEPVPASLVPCISGDAGKAWEEQRSKWLDTALDVLDDDRIYEIADASGTWLSRRTLDSAYLNPSARICMWSDESNVHIEWDNQDRLVDGVPAWSALCGAYCLSRKQFISEVHSFHERLMQEMAERVHRVVHGALPEHVEIDLHGLQREHAQRSSRGDIASSKPSVPTDWRTIEAAKCLIESDHASGA